VVVNAGCQSRTAQIYGLWVLVLAWSRRQRPPLAEASIYFRVRHSGDSGPVADSRRYMHSTNCKMAQRLDVLRTLHSALWYPDNSESERHGLTLKVDMHWTRQATEPPMYIVGFVAPTSMRLCLGLSRFVHSCAQLKQTSLAY